VIQMHDDDDGHRRPMFAEGEFVKPWQLWRLRTRNGERHEMIADANSREELPTKRRMDWHYGIYHNGRPVPAVAKPKAAD
jgi:hypothetical protein